MEPDFDSIRRMEMHNWVRYGHGPAPEDVDRYNREVLGHGVVKCQDSATTLSSKKSTTISPI